MLVTHMKVRSWAWRSHDSMLNKSEGIKKYEDDALFAKSHGGPHDTSKVNVRGQRTVGTRLHSAYLV